MSPSNLFLLGGGLPVFSPLGADMAPQGFTTSFLPVQQPVGGLLRALLGHQILAGPTANAISGLMPFSVDPAAMAALAQAGLAGAAPQPAATPGQQQPATPDLATLEQEAMNGFLQDAASNSLRKLYDYLDKNSSKFPQLAPYPTIISQAVEAFKNKSYSQALGLAYQAHRGITLLRATTPDLPPLQS